MIIVFYNVVLVVHYNDDDYDDDYQNAIYIHFKDKKVTIESNKNDYYCFNLNEDQI